MRMLAAAFLVLIPVLAASAPAAGDDKPPRRDGSRLQQLIAKYDQAGGGNTIPIEQEIIDLRDGGHSQVLTTVLRHPRFGPLAVWALGDLEVAGRDALVAEAVTHWPRRAQIENAPIVAGVPGTAVRTWLTGLASETGLSDADRRHLRVALVRLGVPAARKKLRSELRSKDPGVVAEALLVVGDAHASELLSEVITHATSDLRLKASLTSRWKRQVRTESEDGSSSTTRSLPRTLRTLGEVALEAASRLVACTAPGYVAWWHDPETPPRFDPERRGLELLRAYGKASRQGIAAGAVPVNNAIRTAKGRLKSDAEKQRAGIQVRVRAVEFDSDGYLLEFTETRRTSDGPDECRRSVLVSPKGVVTSIQTSRSPRIRGGAR